MAANFSPSRLEAFSDGVIAVIITIMVLELKVPHEKGLAGLREVLPTLLIYLLSFAFTAIYWVNHHELIGRLHKCNNRILWCNLLWLFSLSLIPYFTSLLIDEHFDSFSTAVYLGCMFMAGASFLLLRYAVDCQLERENRSTALTTAMRIKHWGSLALYGVGLAISQREPKLALFTMVGVTLIWIVPTLGLFDGNAEEAPSASEGGTR